MRMSWLLPPGLTAGLSLTFLIAAAPGGGSVPQLNVGETCRGSTPGDARASDACRRDEMSARKELESQWATIPAGVRQSCLDEVNIGGSPSYVELLTCAQMDKWAKEQPNPTAPGEATRDATRP